MDYSKGSANPGTVAGMRLVRTGRFTEVREVLDVDTCPECGRRFEPRLHTRSWRQCRCAGGTGHRTLHCLRYVNGVRCSGVAHDPPHVIQHGPTASYGGKTAHAPNIDWNGTSR